MNINLKNHFNLLEYVIEFLLEPYKSSQFRAFGCLTNPNDAVVLSWCKRAMNSAASSTGPAYGYIKNCPNNLYKKREKQKTLTPND